MKKNILIVFILMVQQLTMAQNPICPIGTYIADPTARVWPDGKMYIYGSTDDGIGHWCSYKHDVLFSADLLKWNMQTNIFSTKGEKDEVKEPDLYVIVTKWQDKPIVVEGISKAEAVSMLGFSGKVKYSASGIKLTITPPALSPATNPCDYAWVYKVTNAAK
jgi:hypothetical protein